MSRRTLAVDDDLYRYLLDHSLREHPAQAALRAATAAHPHAGMQISPEQGQFMALLVKLLGARRTLEIGVFTGYSALTVALALPDDGRLLACDISDEYTRVGRPYWEQAGVAHKIDLQLAPARATLDARLAAGEAGQYDFAFIDADKTGYDAYYERCLQLLRPGGLIAIDNTLWGGKVAHPAAGDADTAALQALNAKLHGDARVDRVAPSHRRRTDARAQALTRARKRGPRRAKRPASCRSRCGSHVRLRPATRRRAREHGASTTSIGSAMPSFQIVGLSPAPFEPLVRAAGRRARGARHPSRPRRRRHRLSLPRQPRRRRGGRRAAAPAVRAPAGELAVPRVRPDLREGRCAPATIAVGEVPRVRAASPDLAARLRRRRHDRQRRGLRGRIGRRRDRADAGRPARSLPPSPQRQARLLLVSRSTCPMKLG
jgi:caffeoyl-CoA O-methyltransferase